MANQIVILGSSGNVGSATIKALQAKYPQIKVGAGVRDVTSAGAKKLIPAEASNISLVTADLSNPSTLGPAVAGASVVFVVTPGTQNRAELTIAGAKAAKDAGVPHVVVVSVATAELTDTVFGKQLTTAEAGIKALGINYTFLRLPLFVDNHWGNAGSIKAQGAFYGPANPAKKHTPVVVADVGEAAANVLANPGNHVNKTYTLSSPAFTHAELAEAFSAALGKPVNYVQVPYEGAKQAFLGLGMQEWQVNGVLDLYHLIDSDSPVTNNSTAAAQLESLLGHPPTTIAQWTQQVAKYGFAS